MKTCIRLEDDYKTNGKKIQVDLWSNYDVTTKNELLQSSFYFKTTCLIVMKICICLLKNYKTYGKKFQVDSCTNYDVTSKTMKYYNPGFISKLLA